MTKTQMKSFNNIIAQNKNYELLQGVWVGKDSYTYCMCPYYGIKMRDPVPEIQTCKGDPNIECVFDIPAECGPLTPPTIAQLKSHVKGHRRGNCYNPSETAWDFGPGKPWVNPWYLMDVLTILHGASLCYLKGRKALSPIYFVHPAGKGILFPIRKSK